MPLPSLSRMHDIHGLISFNQIKHFQALRLFYAGQCDTDNAAITRDMTMRNHINPHSSQS